MTQLLQDAPDYAPGTQKNVSGEVIRWNNVSGPERLDAKKYIELLEVEIEELNSQLGRKSANGQNELLEYLKSLEPQNLKVRPLLYLPCSILFKPFYFSEKLFSVVGASVMSSQSGIIASI